MSRKKNLAKNTIMLMVGKICTQCVNFFMLPLYTTVLSTEDYGTADLVITYIALLLPLVGLQFEQGLFRFLLDERDKKNGIKKLFSTVIVTNIIQISIFVIVFVPLNQIIGSRYSYYLLLLVPLQLIQATVLQFSRGINRIKIYTLASFISAFVQVFSNVLLVGIFRIGITGLFYSMIVSNVMSILFIVIALRIDRYFNIRLVEREMIKRIAIFSIPLIPNQFAWWIINASDRTIVSYFIGPGENGIYSIACKFSTLYITFYNYFNMSWTESVTLAINDKDKDEYINEMINTFFNLTSCLCIVIIAVMPFLFPILINVNYQEAFYQIPILMIAVFFQALQGLYSAIYVALKMTKEIAKTSVLSAIINIIVNLLFINKIGLYAASLSTLIAFMSMAIFRYVDIQKHVKIKLNKKTIIVTVIVCAFTVGLYYYKNTLLNILSLIVVVCYSFIKNKKILIIIINTIKTKVKL